VVAQIAGYGLLGFRDPYGIRPMCLGFNESDKGVEYMMASESVALEGMGFRFLRDVNPGEAIFIDNDGKLYNQQCAENPTLNPCAFEYVYLARPDSIIDGASVYATRLKMGEFLADKIRNQFKNGEIDVVMPVADSSRPAAMELALKLASSTAKASSRTAISAALSSCRARRCARTRCARSSTPSAASSRARTCCWWMTPSCAAPPAARSCRWRASRAPRT